MSISVLFTPKGASRNQYDESIRRLRDGGQFPPDGMEYHVAFGKDDSFRVLEVWENQEKADVFAKRLIPLLQDIGIDTGKPDIAPVINIEHS
jgi:hypothetical protein